VRWIAQLERNAIRGLLALIGMLIEPSLRREYLDGFFDSPFPLLNLPYDEDLCRICFKNPSTK
jgi:hypothetical protein